MANEELIPRFVQKFYDAQSAVQSGDKLAANQAYHELLGAYKEIAGSQLARPHKELAHQQLTSIYKEISDMSSETKERVDYSNAHKRPQPVSEKVDTPGFWSRLGMRDYLTIGVFALLIVMVLFFKPSTVGLAVFEGNQPPQWVGERTQFNARQGFSTTLDLDSLFEDPDGDELVFLTANEDENLIIELERGILKIEPTSSGEHELTLIASDLNSITKIPVKITVI